MQEPVSVEFLNVQLFRKIIRQGLRTLPLDHHGCERFHELGLKMILLLPEPAGKTGAVERVL